MSTGRRRAFSRNCAGGGGGARQGTHRDLRRQHAQADVSSCWRIRQEPFLKAMPWAQIELYWVDERCVPPDHPDSNYRMTREAMLEQGSAEAGAGFSH